MDGPMGRLAQQMHDLSKTSSIHPCSDLRKVMDAYAVAARELYARDEMQPFLGECDSAMAGVCALRLSCGKGVMPVIYCGQGFIFRAPQGRRDRDDITEFTQLLMQQMLKFDRRLVEIVKDMDIVAVENPCVDDVVLGMAQFIIPYSADGSGSCALFRVRYGSNGTGSAEQTGRYPTVAAAMAACEGLVDTVFVARNSSPYKLMPTALPAMLFRYEKMFGEKLQRP